MFVCVPLRYNHGADRRIWGESRSERRAIWGVLAGSGIRGFFRSSQALGDIEEITLADELGFETAWLAESNFVPPRPMSNPLMMAAAAGQHAKRIRFGTLAAQFPIHHPIHMATQAATCDILTNGRLDLCLGGRWGATRRTQLGQPADIKQCGEQKPGRRGHRADEAGMTQERVTFEGRYWSVKDLATLPRPQQRPHPQLLLAANSDETYPYAARLGIGVIGTTLSQPMPRMTDRAQGLRGGQAEWGRRPAPAVSRMHIVLRRGVEEKALKTMALNWRDDDVKPGRSGKRRVDGRHLPAQLRQWVRTGSRGTSKRRRGTRCTTIRPDASSSSVVFRISSRTWTRASWSSTAGGASQARTSRSRCGCSRRRLCRS